MSDIHRNDPIQGKIVHEYDGIEEADNGLPWWLTLLFFGTTAFGVLYWFYDQEFGIASTPMESYAAAMERRAAEGGEVTEEMLTVMSESPSTVTAGHALFASSCAQCHGERGEGAIGPNLTDRHFLHGGSALEIHRVIDEGVPAKGMPAWGPALGPRAVQQVTAFVLTLRDTNVPGKPPEGEAQTPGVEMGGSEPTARTPPMNPPRLDE